MQCWTASGCALPHGPTKSQAFGTIVWPHSCPAHVLVPAGECGIAYDMGPNPTPARLGCASRVACRNGTRRGGGLVRHAGAGWIPAGTDASAVGTGDGCDNTLPSRGCSLPLTDSDPRRRGSGCPRCQPRVGLLRRCASWEAWRRRRRQPDSQADGCCLRGRHDGALPRPGWSLELPCSRAALGSWPSTWRRLPLRSIC